VDPEHVVQRYGEHVAPRRLLRLVLLELVLGREREPRKIVERPDSRRLEPGRLELSTVERAVGRRVGHLLAQAARLHPRHLGA